MDYLFPNQECSSGCESGWTLYLQHSSISCNSYEFSTRNHFREAKRLKEEEEDDEEDKDLSMVSDASSGPPHLQGDEHDGYGGNVTGGSFCHYPIDQPSNKKKGENRPHRNEVEDQSSLLDDTASSHPLLDFCNAKTRNQPSVEKAMMEYSQGYSTTQFVVEPTYDFLSSSPSGNQMQQNHGWYEGKGW